MKKIGVTALVLVMALACSLAFVSAPADAVDRDIQLSIATVSSQPGANSVAVDLTIDKNVGFFGAQIEIGYDSNLTLTGVRDAGLMDVTYGTNYSSPYGIYVQSETVGDATATGTLLTLLFNVSSSASGEMQVYFNKISMFNSDEYEISPAYNNGKVVIGEIVVPVTGVALDKTSVTLDVGESAQLTPVIAPTNATNKNVSWMSTDPSVATVSGGSVKAVGYGAASIIVTTEDGSKTAACTVTVAKPSTPVTGITLNKSSMTLTVGASDSLIANVQPADATNRTVNWSSSDSKVVVVNNGAVTAVAEGTAVIVATTAEGGFTATCTVKVDKAPDVPVPVQGITLDKSTIALDAGKTQTLVVSIIPSNATNKGVNWSSSNNNIATVSNGIVTAVAPGSAEITATTIDGNKTATCTVVVSAVSVSGVNLNKGSMTIETGKSERLVANVLPDNASNKSVTWSSSNSSVATVDSNGNVKAQSVGSATITVKTLDGGYTAACDVTVKEASPQSSDNTMLYLGIVVAIIIVLLVLFVLLKKSGKI